MERLLKAERVRVDKRRYANLPWAFMTGGIALILAASFVVSSLSPVSISSTGTGSQLFGKILFAQPPYENTNNKVTIKDNKTSPASVSGKVEATKKECKAGRDVNVYKRNPDGKTLTLQGSAVTNDKGEWGPVGVAAPGFFEAQVTAKFADAKKNIKACEEDRSKLIGIGGDTMPDQNTNSKVDIKYDKKSNSFSGRVDGTKKECKQGRTVQVFRQDGGYADPVGGPVPTNDKGEWGPVPTPGPGFYWAYVYENRNAPSRICEDDASKVIEVK